MRLAERKNEIEKLNEVYLSKLEDCDKKMNFLSAKISKYKEKISLEKQKAINYEMDITKQSTELENLRQEKLENEAKISKLEGELSDKIAQLDKISLEIHLKELQKNDISPSLGNELSDLLVNLEAQHTLMKIDRKNSLKTPTALFVEEKNPATKSSEHINSVQKELNEEQIELLEKENSLLIEKLKELQKENERTKIEFQKTSQLQLNSLHCLEKEKEEMKEEISKLKIITPNLASKELNAENKLLRGEIEMLKSVFISFFYEFSLNFSEYCNFYVIYW